LHFFFVVFAVLFSDQLVKFLVVKNMAEGQSIPVIPEIFHLTFVKNYGAAFGIMAYKTSFFVAIGIVVVLIILFFYRRLGHEQKLLRLGLALQLGGAIGNLIDRLRTGYVVDLFDFRIWPVFNLADTAIVIGVALLCWEILRMPEGKRNP
jgi:signal peptidase II